MPLLPLFPFIEMVSFHLLRWGQEAWWVYHTCTSRVPCPCLPQAPGLPLAGVFKTQKGTQV